MSLKDLIAQEKAARESSSVQDSGSQSSSVSTPESAMNKVSPFIQNDAAHIATEFVDGVFGGVIRNAAKNPVRFLASGAPGVQLAAGANIPTQVKNLFTEDSEIPFKDEKTNVEKFLPGAETKTGEIAGFAANVAGGLVGYPGKTVVKSVDSAVDYAKSATAGPIKVKKIQQAFFDYNKAATTKYGQALKGARKADDFSAMPKVQAKEMEAILSPIREAGEEVVKNIPAKARRIAEFVAKPGKKGKAASDFSLEDLISKKVELRRTLSAPERTGKIVSERSKIVNQTIRNIDQALLRKVPGLAKANKEYAMFSRVKELLQKFEPRFGNLPPGYGTIEGEKFLKQALNFTQSEVKLLRDFENVTNLKFVNSAKTAARIEKLAGMVGKIAGLTATIGALRAAGADRLFFQAADAAN